MKMMQFKQALQILCVAALFRLSPAQRTPENAMQKILNIVTDPEKYHKEIPPFNESGPIDVKISVFIYSLELDDVKMQLDANLIFRMYWTDPRLAYNDEQGGVNRITFQDATKFWTPDLFFGNSVLSEKMNHLTKDPEVMFLIRGDGSIIYSTRIHVKVSCPMNLQYFPHDSQLCPIEIESYASSMQDILIEFQGSGISLDPPAASVSMNRLFRIMNTTTRSIVASTSTGTYQRCSIEILFKRETSLYVVNFYIPCMCLVIIALVSEFLEASAIMPRLALSVGPLLTLQVLAFFYNRTLPVVTFITSIDIYAGVSMIIIFLVFLHSVLGYYYNMNPLSPDHGGVLGQKLKAVRARSSLIIKLLIGGTYILFLIIYFSYSQF